ncbi:DUF3079 domain-containing protein [Pseudomonas lini]|uniref:DUF3079 domain-containing protein n=1 Tax=Pseudomonas lini TaxID=163011 RepID=UPI0021CADC8F|nr:DUF3079 domain-containing protein [Pseudomonas lini]
MAKNFPVNPKHPERICWGCDLYCPAKSLACGNGSERTMHPAEMFGEDWHVPGSYRSVLLRRYQAWVMERSLMMHTEPSSGSVVSE